MQTRWFKIFLMALLCVIVFCMVATTSKIVEIEELPFNFIAALLEAVITAVITMVLLTGQSSAEEIKERNVKVFEVKSRIFQDYINLVWHIWEDHVVTTEEYLELTTQYYKILMIYLNKKSLQVIGRALSTIGEYLTDDKPDDTQNFRDSIFTIINTLSEELSLGGQIDIQIYEDLERKMDLCRERRRNILAAYVKRGVTYAKNGDYDHARADFEKVLKLDPGNRDAINNLQRLPPIVRGSQTLRGNDTNGEACRRPQGGSHFPAV